MMKKRELIGLIVIAMLATMIPISGGCSEVQLSGKRLTALNNQINDTLILTTDPEASDEALTEQLSSGASFWQSIYDGNLFNGVILSAGWRTWVFEVTALATLDARDAQEGKLDRDTKIQRLGKNVQALKILRAANAGQDMEK